LESISDPATSSYLVQLIPSGSLCEPYNASIMGVAMIVFKRHDMVSGDRPLLKTVLHIKRYGTLLGR
jgi:hypothetical protein